jgi:hypothetical protein
MRLFASASLVMFVILFSSTGWGADWKFYTSHLGEPWYYDSQSIRQVSEDTVRVWTKSTASKERLGEEAKFKIRSIKVVFGLYEFTCSTKKVRLLSLIMYDKNGSILFSTSNPGPWGPPNELDDMLINIVCRPIYELDRGLKEEEKRE